MNAMALPDGGQQDVAAGLIGLRLDREPDVVSLVVTYWAKTFTASR